MRSFVGCVILESLTDPAPVAWLLPLAQRVAEMPDDPDAKVWHVNWYHLSENELRSRLPALAAAMRPHWYAHFWCEDDLCVILPGKAFWARASDRATWHEFIAYGDNVGVERKWTESVPTTLPGWVKEALAASLGLQGV